MGGSEGAENVRDEFKWISFIICDADLYCRQLILYRYIVLAPATPLAQASLHPSWQHDPLFPTFPLLSSSDVAVLTLAQPVR